MRNNNDQAEQKLQQSLDRADDQMKMMIKVVAEKMVDMTALALLCWLVYLLFVSAKRFFFKKN